MGNIKFILPFNCLLFLSFLFGVHCSFGQEQPANPKQFQVALFDVDATPPIGSFLAYVARENRDDPFYF